MEIYRILADLIEFVHIGWAVWMILCIILGALTRKRIFYFLYWTTIIGTLVSQISFGTCPLTALETALRAKYLGLGEVPSYGTGTPWLLAKCGIRLSPLAIALDLIGIFVAVGIAVWYINKRRTKKKEKN